MFPIIASPSQIGPVYLPFKRYYCLGVWVSFFMPKKPGATLVRLLQDTGFRGHLADMNPEGWTLSRAQLSRTFKEMPFPQMAIEVLAHMHRYASEMRQARVLTINLRGPLSRP